MSVKKMNKLIISIVAATALLCSGSCNKYLDVIPDNVATLEYAFRDRVSTLKYLATCYSRLPRPGTFNDPGFMAADDLWFHPDLDNFRQLAYELALNGNNTNRPLFSYWHNIEGGLGLWQAIRDCNTFIENAHLARDLDSFERAKWIAEVKTLKAYYHFYLMKLYGPIPIVRENLPITADPDAVKLYREPIDEVVDYIVELLDEAIPDLPLSIDNEVSEAGRITKPVAVSVKAKVLVTAASPLFNGNRDYANLIDNRGLTLFSQVEDPSKWSRAALACKQAIDTCHRAGIQLYEFNNPSLNINDSTKYVLTASQVVTHRWNTERIWGLSSFVSNELQFSTMPRLAPNHENAVYQRLVPTLKMAEMYYSANGVPIWEDRQFDYDRRFDIVVVQPQDRYFMQPGYEVGKLHLNREPRFYGSIAVDGGWWFGLGRLDDRNQWPMNFKLGSMSGGRIGTQRYSVTTYYIKKLASYLTTYNNTVLMESRYDFPIFRLADLYLLYAEALNESLSAPDGEVYRYIDLVRERSGLKGVVASWADHSHFPDRPHTTGGMREIIHQERCIELAFEAHRFWDIRRWKKAIEYYNQPIQGLNTEGTNATELYQPVTHTRKPYTLRDVLWPIMQDELLRNTNLIQNPGW